MSVECDLSNVVSTDYSNIHDVYHNQMETDRSVRELDPLGLDDFMIEYLPEINEEGTLDELVSSVESFEYDEDLGNLNYEQSLAALRDLGMLASSIRKKGGTLDEVSRLEEDLIRLGNAVDEPPSDTVYAYGMRNPTGDRTRTFTDEDDERLFISGVREGMSELPHAVEALDIAQEMSIYDDEFAEVINSADNSFKNMVSAMGRVYQNITPNFFTDRLRPYFEPREIDGETYLGAGGAQMPVIALDHILWGAEDDNQMYVDYFLENEEYQPPEFRERIREIQEKDTIVDSVEEEWSQGDIDETAVNSLDALDKLLRTQKQFRQVHLVTAKENMNVRSDGAVGSGGYDTEILEFLMSRTEDTRDRINALNS
jgi:hypothetical protein